MVHALLPVKDLVLAKSRLSGVLAPQERRSINQAMVEDVLEVLSSHSGIESVMLVSDDPSVMLLAEKYSATLFSEREAGANGLNEALTAACDSLVYKGASDILIVHGDMPLFNASDLGALLVRCDAAGIDAVFGPDSKNEGTNAMLISASRRPDLRYGPNSFSRHKASAGQLGLNYAVVRRSGIEQDVDTPAGLLAVFDARGSVECGQRTARFLSDPEIANRLNLFREAGIEATDNEAIAANA